MQVRFRQEVVDSVPEVLQANILYVTKDGDVAGHLCACGCMREVITPLSPTDWSISFDRRGASLYPSIGNWAFPCRSHYFIRDGAVVWARNMSENAIAAGRQRDKASKQKYYDQRNNSPTASATPLPKPLKEVSPSVGQSLLQKWRAWWRRMFVE